MQKKAGVILNPVAGKKRGKAMLADLLEGLCRLDYEPTVHVTTDRGDATRSAVRFGQTSNLVCCIGGDGTLNEVITGLMTISRPTELLYLPTGSTNDFANICGLSSEISSLLTLLSRNQTVKVDLGRLDERYFTYIASFGLFTKASYSADQNMKNLIGHFAYVLEGAKELTDLGKTYHMRITCERGIVEGDFIFGGMANTTSLGGIFQLPKRCVTLNDGKFELLLIREPKTVDDAMKILNMMQKGDFDESHIVFLQTSFARFQSDVPIAWCLDGEYAGERKEVMIENRCEAFTLYANPDKRMLASTGMRKQIV